MRHIASNLKLLNCADCMLLFLLQIANLISLQSAGLCWIRIPNDSSSGQERLSMLFFAIMLFCLTPFGWQAFALAEKRFFVLDSAKGLYSPSAYFVSYVLSSKQPQPLGLLSPSLLNLMNLMHLMRRIREEHATAGGCVGLE